MSFGSKFYKRRHINADITSQPGQITGTIVNLKCLNYTAFAAATSKTEPQNTMPLLGRDACDTVDTSTGAFQATQLWEKIVMHLERSMKSRRRIRKLRTFEDCFPGSKAVECLTDYLNTILPKTIKRSQVQTLCQKLLLTGVIEDVMNKEKSVFHEGRLFRFTGFHFWEAESPDGSSRKNGKDPKSSKSCNAEHNPKETCVGSEKSRSSTAFSSALSEKMEQTGDEIKCVASEAVHHTVLPQDQRRCTRNVAETQKPDSTVDKPRRRSTICQKLSHFYAKMSRKNAVMYKEAQTQDIIKHRTSSVKFQKISTMDFRDRTTRDKDFAPHSYCDHTDITQGPTVFINLASLHTSHSFSSASTLSESTSTHKVIGRRLKVVEYGVV